MLPFLFNGIDAYHQALIEKKYSCEHAVTCYLNTIKKHSNLNVFIEVFEEDALTQAQKLDQDLAQNKPLLPLSGVVVSIKDVFCYENHISSAGSKMLHNYKAVYTATAVKRIVEAGGIIIGRTNCDEFAMGSTNQNSFYGPTLNPNNPKHTPGGSSGGAAAAVKAKMCMVALGSDTGGSVRQPADFCGVFGFKPSNGSVSRYGLIAYASSFDCVGILANNVQDLTQTFQVIAGSDQHDHTVTNLPKYPNSQNHPPTPRLGYFKTWLDHKSLDPDIRANILTFLENQKQKGFSVVALDAPDMEILVPVYYIIATAEAASNLSRFDGLRYGYHVDIQNKTLSEYIKANRTEAFGTEVKKRILIGNFVLSAEHKDAYYAKAHLLRNQLKQQYRNYQQQVDVIITPTTPTTAFKLHDQHKNSVDVYLADVYTVYANLVGAPAMALPLFKHRNNLPFGLQIIGATGQDLALLANCHHFINN